MRARAPASTANLGPGFDVLALALSLYVEVEVVPAKSFSLSSQGEGSAIACDEKHLAAKVALAVCGHDRVAIRIRSEIPLRRGLGSSAALAVAVAAAAGAPDPFQVAAEFEGHPENAAASIRGGLVCAAVLGAGPVLRSFPLDEGLSFVVIVPERELSTREARAALSPELSRSDVVFNLSRMALLLAGLADRSLLVPEAGQDRVHQSQRSRLFPEASEILARLTRAGALTSCWSGAGPSLLAICDGPLRAGLVRDAGEAALADLGVSGRALVLEPDLEGLVVGQ